MADEIPLKWAALVAGIVMMGIGFGLPQFLAPISMMCGALGAMMLYIAAAEFNREHEWVERT